MPSIPLLTILSLAANAAAAMPPLTSITLEQDCNGCLQGTRTVLHADGRAELFTVGKARLGTADAHRAGQLPTARFQALAQLVEAGGVLRLPATPADDGLQDGPWVSLRIERSDGRIQEVFSRGGPTPPDLAAVVRALETATRDIAFPTPPQMEGGR